MRHTLSFRGEDHEIPAGMGRCTACDALVTLEQWLDTTCPGRPSTCQCPEHACSPDRTQADRYPIQGGLWLCAQCFALGHASPLRLQYAGLLP